MQKQDLTWKINGRKEILQTPIFTVHAQNETAACGINGEYIAIDAPVWIAVVPVIDNDFVLVRQWRHAMNGLTVEFPGGLGDPGEEPKESALRELEEETGFKAGKMTHLGTCSPNPALFSNEIHFYLAEDLQQTGKQHLDADEVLSYERVPIQDVIDSFCSGEYVNAFMGVALMLYQRYRKQ